MKKAITLLLCIILCLGLCVPALGAYNDDVTVSAALDQAELNYDASKDQTVQLTVSLSKSVSLYSISLQADIPSGLTLSALESGSSAIYLEEDEHYSLETGRVSWYAGKNKEAADLVILTVTVPAGTAAGSYKIGVKEIELATAGENDGDNWMEGGSAYATLTIKGETKSYTVKFSANGGSGSMKAQTITEGKKLTLPENGFTAPEGKQFKAWDVGGKEYAPGVQVAITANTTVKAIWEDIPVVTYTVSFAANGGSGSMSKVTGISGSYKLPENKFTAPEGKQFKAWSVGGKEYAAGASIEVTADTTVKAIWEDIPVVTYTVSFAANGGSGSMSKVTGISGSYKLPENKFTAPEGKQFKAWDVGGKEYAAGASIEVTADTTVKAVWEDIPVVSYTVSFVAGDGTGTMADVTADAGDYTLPACSFTAPEGKQFKAWNVNGKEYAAGAAVTISADTTIMAVWEDIPVTYTVSFDANGGSGTMAVVTVNEGDYTLPECSFTAPEGKEYKAWKIGEDEYQPNNVYKVNADTVITALWQDAPVVTETVATPKLPKSGEFSGTKTITITCATKGADIYYTVDGSSPSAASTLYTGAFTISGTTTVKAIAIMAGMNDSEIASATYTLYSSGGGGDWYGGTIRVSMRLIGAELAAQDVDLGASSYLPDYVTWIPTTFCVLPEGATVYDLWVKVTGDAGIRSIGADKNYVATVYAPAALGGYALSEFTNGYRSGWMYTINGNHPGFGLKEQKLRDGDVVIWHYINDYSYECADWVSEGKWQALGDGTYYNGWLKAPDIFGGKATGNTDKAEDKNNARFENGAVILEAETESGTAFAKLDKETAETGLKLSKDKDQLTVKIENKSASRTILSVDPDAVKSIAGANNALRVETDKGNIMLDTADVAALAKNGQEVRIVLDDQSGGAVKLSVTAGSTTANVTMKVELPASSGGQVLVLVNPNGTEKVLKKSIVENGKAYAEIPSGATVKVIANKKTFNDVKASDWYASAVDFVSSHELFQGVGEGNFAPKAPMTRAMLVTVLYRLEDEPAVSGTVSFNDVPADSWYAKAVAWAAKEGIVMGNGSGFAPNDNITREQIATILYRYAQYLGIDVSAKGSVSRFSDGSKVSGWAADAMAWAVEASLFQGDDSNCLNPGSNATRAEVATLMQRLVKLIVK